MGVCVVCVLMLEIATSFDGSGTQNLSVLPFLHCLTAGIYFCKVIGLHGAVTESLSYTGICVCSSNETDICGPSTN